MNSLVALAEMFLFSATPGDVVAYFVEICGHSGVMYAYAYLPRHAIREPIAAITKSTAFSPLPQVR